jgi:hypothetical protein
MFNRGIFDYFIYVPYFTQHCFVCRPLDSTVSEDAGIEPRTVATLALAVRRSKLSARSHPQSRPDLIHDSARSHSQLGQISSTFGQISSTNQLESFVMPTDSVCQLPESMIARDTVSVLYHRNLLQRP